MSYGLPSHLADFEDDLSHFVDAAETRIASQSHRSRGGHGFDPSRTQLGGRSGRGIYSQVSAGAVNSGQLVLANTQDYHPNYFSESTHLLQGFLYEREGNLFRNGELYQLSGTGTRMVPSKFIPTELKHQAKILDSIPVLIPYTAPASGRMPLETTMDLDVQYWVMNVDPTQGDVSNPVISDAFDTFLRMAEVGNTWALKGRSRAEVTVSVTEELQTAEPPTVTETAATISVVDATVFQNLQIVSTVLASDHAFSSDHGASDHGVSSLADPAPPSFRPVVEMTPIKDDDNVLKSYAVRVFLQPGEDVVLPNNILVYATCVLKVQKARVQV